MDEVDVETDDRLTPVRVVMRVFIAEPDNIAALMANEDIDGALVGGASLSPESFAKIVTFH